MGYFNSLIDRTSGRDIGDATTPIVAKVYASDAPNKPSATDATNWVWVCDGTADETEINAAIDAIQATTTGYGKIELSTGTFNLAATITLDSPKITVVGQGISTLLQLSGDCDAITLSGNSTAYITLRDFYLYGNKATRTGSGIYINTACGDSYDLFDNIYISDFETNGVKFASVDVRYTQWHNVNVNACDGDGWVVKGTDHRFDQCQAMVCAGNGWNITATYSFYNQCSASGNGTNSGAYYGFEFGECKADLVGCFSQNNKSSGYHTSNAAASVTLTNCIADQNGQDSGATVRHGVTISNGINWRIIGGRFTGSSDQTVGIKLMDAASGCLVDGAYFDGNSAYAYQDISTGLNYIKNCIGFSTDSKGPAIYVVAASDAPIWAKSAANAVCNGTADEVEINAAITAVNAAGGGKVELSEGTFILSDSVVPLAKVTLQGAGKLVTIIRCTDPSKSVISETAGVDYYGIRDLAVSYPSASITAVGDNGSGKARITAALTIGTGQKVAVCNTTDYDGIYTEGVDLTVIDSTHFDITGVAYTSSQTGVAYLNATVNSIELAHQGDTGYSWKFIIDNVEAYNVGNGNFGLSLGNALDYCVANFSVNHGGGYISIDGQDAGFNTGDGTFLRGIASVDKKESVSGIYIKGKSTATTNTTNLIDFTGMKMYYGAQSSFASGEAFLKMDQTQWISFNNLYFEVSEDSTCGQVLTTDNYCTGHKFNSFHVSNNAGATLTATIGLGSQITFDDCIFGTCTIAGGGSSLKFNNSSGYTLTGYGVVNQMFSTSVQAKDEVARISEILGGNASILRYFPMVETSGTAITDYGPVGTGVVANQPITSFDSRPQLNTLTAPGRLIMLNGTDEIFQAAADDADLSFTSGGGTDTAFSILMVVRPWITGRSGTYEVLAAKSADADKLEWTIRLDATTQKLNAKLYTDADANKTLAFITDTYVPTADTAVVLAFTYDGLKTAATSGKWYVNGVLTASTGTDTGTYAGMGNKAGKFTIGASEDADLGTKGGFGSILITNDVLTATEIWTITQMLQAKYGI